jgi:hypothetical protein
MANKTLPIESIQQFSLGAAIFALIGITLLAAGIVAHNIHLVLLSLLPWMLATGMYFSRPSGFRGELTETGLIAGDSTREIAFENIHALTLAGKPQDPDDERLKAGPLIVIHKHGILEIPANSIPPVQDLYRALLTCVPNSGSRIAHVDLFPHMHNEEELFGADRVHTFNVRATLGRKPSKRRSKISACLTMLCGLIWILIAALAASGKHQNDLTPWIISGFIIMMVGLLFFLILVSRDRYPIAWNEKLRSSCLIASPSGIALIQGDLKGLLRWEELQNVSIVKRPQFLAVSAKYQNLGNLQLTISGAEIQIFDIYDRPLPLIKKVICRYWKGEQ